MSTALTPSRSGVALVDPKLWRGRRVLITGHTGFKGSWLTLYLRALGAHVHGFSRSTPAAGSLYALAGLADEIDAVHGDLRDSNAVREAVTQSRPEIVFHLAAQPLVGESLRDPPETFTVNVVGTANVLDAVRHADGVHAVVNVSTDMLGADLGAGHTPYTSSKACSELVSAAYRDSIFRASGPRVADARTGNLVGGGDFGGGRLVADVMRAAEAGEPVIVRAPHNVRPWQHVLNPLSGYLLLAQRLISSDAADGTWSFGPDDDDTVSVGALVDRLGELWPGGIDRTGAEPSAPATLLSIDSSRARAELGWQPAWDLDRSLRAVVEWHRAHRDGDNVGALVDEQVREHQRVTVATAA